MNNYKLTILYDGTNYSGWQYQKNSVSIQHIISEAINKIINEKINLIGSGRTDAGVHALGQVANFLSDKVLNCNSFKYSLNAVLPKDIAVNRVESVNKNFHSRFDAKKRTYIYLFSKNKSPFYDLYSYNYKPIFDYDLSKMNDVSKLLLGQKDFSSFCKKKSEVENKICNLTEIKWYRKNDFIFFLITSDRFLHGMVRTIIGTLLETAKKNFDKDFLQSIIESKDREEAKEAVPAKGLFLFKVRY
ncbi:MAG: tRNA pseudouridine(38-40) synthase TruA [Melioribacteraceae bacterium]|nr:tRNA pseudouridine(38-40) synthase TruA [Melioribacteraceae bacterium]